MRTRTTPTPPPHPAARAPRSRRALLRPAAVATLGLLLAASVTACGQEAKGGSRYHP